MLKVLLSDFLDAMIKDEIVKSELFPLLCSNSSLHAIYMYIAFVDYCS